MNGRFDLSTVTRGLRYRCPMPKAHLSEQAELDATLLTHGARHGESILNIDIGWKAPRLVKESSPYLSACTSSKPREVEGRRFPFRNAFFV